MRILSTILILAGALGAPAVAERVEFIAEWEGARLPGAEVCFFPSSANDGFFAKFLDSNDVRCLSADDVLEVPGGNWNYFLRHPEFVSTHPSYIEGAEGADGPGHALKRDVTPMHRAATLSIARAVDDLRAGEFFAVYITNQDVPGHGGSVRPAADGATEMLVPAGVPLIPMIVKDRRPVRFGEPLVIEPGKRAEAVMRIPREGKMDLAAVTIAKATTEERIAGVVAPSVVFREEGGSAHLPVLPVRATHAFDRSLHLFIDVPRVSGVVELSGPKWVRATAAIARPASVVVVAEMIEAIPAATLTVEMDAGFDTMESSCDRSDEDDPLAAGVSVARCGMGFDDCAPFAARPVTLPGGRAEFEALPEGTYRVQGIANGSAAEPQLITLQRLESRRIVLESARAKVSGRITRDGEPVAARIRFSSSGRSVSDRHTGSYVASLSRIPVTGTVEIQPCDGSPLFTAVIDVPIEAGSVHDFEIPPLLEVRVVDMDGAAVEGARVFASILGSEGDDLAHVPATETSGGTAVTGPFADRARVRIGVFHPKYDPASREIEVTDRLRREGIEISLEASAQRVGRILAPVSLLAARLWTVLPDGRIHEAVLVEPDGSFVLRKKEEPGTSFVVSAFSLGLAVLERTRHDIDLELSFPQAPPRTFSIAIAPGYSLARGRFTLEVDGLVLPQEIVAFHQQREGRGDAVVVDEPVTVARVIPRARLAVILGPHGPIGSPAGPIDPFADRAVVATMDRREMGIGASQVVFD